MGTQTGRNIKERGKIVRAGKESKQIQYLEYTELKVQKSSMKGITGSDDIIGVARVL